uniref:TSEN54 tRNA splicing endonuclease subunit n=1 Tax=Neogobius melanostomus TaxID=47308 RepID=A0A8C6S8T9_9GOBI
MGFSANGKQCLLPEEALFLMECGNVQVFYQGLPFSIQDGYEKFLSVNSISFNQYLVYGHLKRLGYVVLRFNPSHQTEMPEEEPGCKQEVKHKEWWSPADVSTITESSSTTGSCPWDFSSIHFPDVGSVLRFHSKDAASLTPPDPSLLPGAVTVGPCDIALWRRRVNLKEIRMSHSDQRKEDEKYRRKQDINKDPEVRRCRTWSEYRQLMTKRRSDVGGRPAHLWDREVKPLHDPAQAIPHEELLEKISIIKSTNLLEGASRLQPLDDWRISFSVFQPDSVSSFKKSSPGRPYVRMVVCSFDGPVPDLSALKQLSSQSPEVPLVFAAVDHGDISFYTFKDFHLPRDVFP